MRGRSGVGVWQPDVEWHETGLDAETGEPGQQKNRQRLRIVACMVREVVEVPTAGQLMQNEEGNNKGKHAGVGRHQIPESALANFFFLPIEDDRKVSSECHDFPYDEKDERILDDDHKLQ